MCVWSSLLPPLSDYSNIEAVQYMMDEDLLGYSRVAVFKDFLEASQVRFSSPFLTHSLIHSMEMISTTD